MDRRNCDVAHRAEILDVSQAGIAVGADLGQSRVSHLRCLASTNLYVFPALPRWAKFFRASGAVDRRCVNSRWEIGVSELANMNRKFNSDCGELLFGDQALGDFRAQFEILILSSAVGAAESSPAGRAGW